MQLDLRNMASEKIATVEKARKAEFNNEVQKIKDDAEELCAAYGHLFPSWYDQNTASASVITDQIRDIIDEEDDPRDALVLLLEEDLEAEADRTEEKLDDNGDEK